MSRTQPGNSLDVAKKAVVTVTTKSTTLDVEREALLRFLAEQRDFLLHTLKGLDEEQATLRTTKSVLHLAGIVKHVSHSERSWVRFIEEGASEYVDYDDPAAHEDHEDTFRLIDDETLEQTLEHYAQTALQTEEFVRALPDLEVGQTLPPAPWFPADTVWTARDVLLMLIRETAQHCGHADIIRESLDGQKTMG